MDKKLYIATDLDGGDLLDATWATSESEAYDYFNNRESMIPDQNDRLYVELAEKSGYTLDEIKEELPELFEEGLSEDVGAELNVYEMIAARALHFMRINCDMEYVDIANELDIDVQEVLNLIGPDSYDDADDYDDSDIMLEAYEQEVITNQKQEEPTTLKESYRRTVSRGKPLNENELFVDFD